MASLSSLKPCWAFEISSSDRYCCYPVAVLLPVQPYVEVEDIFVSKAVRSLQLKLRECLVIPPVERMQQRYSVCFPDRMCTMETPTADDKEHGGGEEEKKEQEDVESKKRPIDADICSSPKRIHVDDTERLPTELTVPVIDEDSNPPN